MSLTAVALHDDIADDEPTVGRLTDIPPELLGVSSAFEYVTPADAQYLLGMNTRNRTMRPIEVKKIAAEITRDNWTINGETIKISRDGVLLDGQHRLAAIVESSTPVWTLVVRGLPDAAMSTIDTGRSRTMSQIVSMAGFTNSNHRSAVARIVYGFEVLGKTSTHGIALSPTDMLSFLQTNNLDDAVSLVSIANVNRTPGSSTVLAAAWHICAKIDRDAAQAFYIDQVVHTLGLTPTAPARALRSRLTSFGENSTTAKGDQFRFMLAAWNAFRDGRGLRALVSPRGGWTDANAPTPR